MPSSQTVEDKTDLVLASAHNNLRLDVLISWPHLYNRSGATLSPGALVIADVSHDESYTTTTNEDEDLVIGIVKEETPNDAQGYLWPFGAVVDVDVVGAVTRGHFLASSTTAGRAKDIGTALTLGTIGMALEVATGPGNDTIKARIMLGKTARHDSLMGMMVLNEPKTYLTAEDGDFLITEDGKYLISEVAAYTCPAQWARFTALDGKFPKAGTTYGGTGGTTNHHHEYSECPEHTHSHSESLDSGGSHNHSVGSLSVGSAGSHSHTYSKVVGGSAISSGSGYALSNNATGSGGTHSHSTCSGHTVSAGTHAHSISLTINNAGTAPPHDTATVDNIPPYREIIFCEKTTNDEL